MYDFEAEWLYPFPVPRVLLAALAAGTQRLALPVSKMAVKLCGGSALALSPDGRWALCMERSGERRLILCPTGVGTERVLDPGDIYLTEADFFPDGRRVIFVSNVAATDPRKRNFDLWMVADDGTGLERVTFHEEFDGFPMFSPDGRRLVFASNRGPGEEGETNLFLADWAEDGN